MNVVPIAPTETVEVSFANWYLLYPRHEARKDAGKAWDALSADDRYLAIVAIASWRRVFLDRAQGRGIVFVPLPATWLRAERWTDELPEEYRSRAASHQQAVSTPLPARGELPPHIVALFAKLKGGKT